jgi:hypothetical protein
MKVKKIAPYIIIGAVAWLWYRLAKAKRLTVSSGSQATTPQAAMPEPAPLPSPTPSEGVWV